VTDYHQRNPAKHEYEIEHAGAHIFVGNRERTAVRKGAELLSGRRGDDHVRLYHTYPSPGPVRRYVGLVTADGTLVRAR
jgi:hypothetical protein